MLSGDMRVKAEGFSKRKRMVWPHAVACERKQPPVVRTVVRQHPSGEPGLLEDRFQRTS